MIPALCGIATYIRDTFAYSLMAVAFLAWLQTTAGLSACAWLHALPDQTRGAAAAVGIFVVFICVWHGYGLLLHVLDTVRHPALERYKLHRRDTLTYRQMLPVVLRNQLVVLLPTLVTSAVIGVRALHVASPLPPSTPYILMQQALLYVVYEVLTYFGHRVLHLPAFYRFHKMHHSTFCSVGISAQYASPLDFFLMLAGPWGAGFVLCGTHPAAACLFVLIGAVNSVQSHSGYRFPFMLPPDGHEAHHARSNVNFGTPSFCDWLLGTYA